VTERARDVARARTLSIASVAWGGGVAIAAINAGLESGSVSLIGFGADSAIDAIASIALVWRFHVERRDPGRALPGGHAAERAVGAVLVVAAVGLLLGAGRAVLTQTGSHPGISQIVLLLVSLVVLPPLAIAKRRVARDLDSKALANDALLTAAAGLLAFVALIAAILSQSGELWWADAVGSFVIAAILLREGAASVGWSRSNQSGGLANGA
jgi:divalent metal cation (Fe/Co/Zn/Cd) transporter